MANKLENFGWAMWSESNPEFDTVYIDDCHESRYSMLAFRAHICEIISEYGSIVPNDLRIQFMSDGEEYDAFDILFRHFSRLPEDSVRTLLGHSLDELFGPVPQEEIGFSKYV